METELYMKVLRPVDHLHGEHELHSRVIAEPFVFISLSFTTCGKAAPSRISRVAKRVVFDLQKVCDSFSRTWEYRWTVPNKIRFAKALVRTGTFYACIIHPPIYLSKSCYVNLACSYFHTYLSSLGFPGTNHSFFHTSEYLT